MKLSMWMIANRLEGLDLELEIEENAPAVLNSARRAYATNCVHIYQEGSTAVCSGRGGVIRIRDISLGEAFEIVQSIFDFYEDWLELVTQKIMEKNYQAVADVSWQVFRNPLILLDGDNKVLGLTSRYPADALDSEWAYLWENGCTSLNAVEQMKYRYGNIDFGHPGSQGFDFEDNRRLGFPGISFSLYFNEIFCGRITALYRDRRFNEGDFQLLEKLARLLEPSLGQLFLQNTISGGSVFYNVLFGQPWDEERLDIQLSYQHWNRQDTFYLTVIRLNEAADEQTVFEYLNTLASICTRRVPDAVPLKKNSCVLLLSSRNLGKEQEALEFLRGLAENNPVRIGFSLPCRGLEKASFLFSQAQAAIDFGMMEKPDQVLFYFFDYAQDYILTSPSIRDSTAACMPAVEDLWELYLNNGDEMFYTLKCFLDNERSVAKTSTRLYTHRNTILYRIKKIEEFLRLDLNDLYTRDYCRLSIRVLELSMLLGRR